MDISTTEPADRFYRPELDWLRFFAFFTVFLLHAAQTDHDLGGIVRGLPGALLWVISMGRLGVDLFFVLSSYLITELLLRESERFGSISIRAFYLRRILRIWPLYYFFLIGALTVVPLLLPGNTLGGVHRIAYLCFLGNWSVAFNGWPVPLSVATPLWSVSIEEQFYLTWPLLLTFIRIERLKWALIALAGGALLTRVVLHAWNVPDPGTSCNTIAHLDPIIGGALLALVYRRRSIRVSPWIGATLWVTGSVLLYYVTVYGRYDGVTSILFYPAVAGCCALLLFAVLATHFPSTGGAVSRAFSYLGRISYGLYVYHLFAVTVVYRFMAGLGSAGAFVLSLAGSILLASLSYRLIEKPFLRLKRKHARIQTV